MTEEDAVVKVEADGQTRYYKAIDDAFTDENQDGTVTLMKDVTNGHTIYVTGGPYILDLNGCDMSSVSEDSVTVTVGKADGDKGNLTVKDSGTDGRLEKLVVESGSLTVGNGSFGFVGDNASSCIGSTLRADMQMSSRSTPEVTGPMVLAILLTVSARSSSGGGSSAGSSSANAVSTSGKSDNGSVSADKSTAKKGDTVAITVTPDAGYELGKLTVTDSKGNGKYTFTMPDSKVTVPPTFTKVADEKPSTTGYVDVASSAWYNDAIQYVTDKGLMSGTGDNKFSPSSSTTRGMLMTVLARYAGQDTTNSIPWYQAGMDWAKANGVSDGTNPTINITREQLVTMLYRYAGSPAANGSLDSFTDASTVSSYAVSAMQWGLSRMAS